MTTCHVRRRDGNAQQDLLPPAAEKRERLLLAAEEEFARVPYAEASINRMIRAAGIPRGSFYMYFRDKEELSTTS